MTGLREYVRVPSAPAVAAFSPGTRPSKPPSGQSGLNGGLGRQLEAELGVEIGVLAVAVADLLRAEQLDEDADDRGVELAARDAHELRDRLGRGDRLTVGVARRHHVVGVRDRDDAPA